VLKERDGLLGEVKRLETARSAQNPEASSLALDLQVPPIEDSKEVAELRENLATVTKENAAYLRLFQE
jgi:hypothetical protein